MPVTNQSLNDIKTSLTNISAGLSSMSSYEKAKLDKSGATASLAGGLTTLGGTLTSEQARRTVANTQKDSTKTNTSSGSGINDAYSKLFAENNKTKADLAAAQAQLTSAQSGLSIADQQKKQVEDEAAAALLKGKKNATTAPNAPADASAGLEDLAGADPILKAMSDSANEQRASITSQLDVLNRQMLDADEDTKFMVRQIENMANQQITRQEKSNEQMVRGAKVAGLSAGIAQYSPETHSGIVQETINDGLALIQDIEFKAMEKKYEAKKDLRDFNYKGYLESQKLVTEYNDLKNKTIISMYEQIQKAETDAREQIKFDNEQADRNAFILAPELMDADQNTIYETALANGIDPGLLAREVQTYKDEQRLTGLDIQSKIASINASNRSNQPEESESEKPLTLSEISTATQLYGLGNVGTDGKTTSTLIPNHWTNSDLAQFNSMYGNDIQIAETIDEKREILKKFNTVIDAAGEGVEKGLQGEALNTYVAERVASTRKSISEVKQEATNLIKNDIDSFVRAARESGNDALGPSKKRDVTAWIMSPSTQSEIEELAKTMSPSQIVKELKKRYGEKVE